MTPKIIEDSSGELITIEECRSHLNLIAFEIDSDGNATHPDDAMIMAMLGAARNSCEQFTGRSLVRRTYEIALNEFPMSNPQYQRVYPTPIPSGRDGAIELPFPPMVSVLSMSLGTDSDALMVDGTDYQVDDYSVPARVLPVSSWPYATSSLNQIKIRYLAGYGIDSDGGESLPSAIRAAIMLTLGSIYGNRENEIFERGSVLTLTHGVEFLLRPYRVKIGMA